MYFKFLTGSLLGVLFFGTWGQVANAEPKTKLVSSAALYQTNCSSCHGADRLGLMGPALLPENLSRLRQKKALEVIKNGRVATQMPSFSDKLSDQQIKSLVDMIYTPLEVMPEWGLADINNTQKVFYKDSDLSDKPTFEADMMNLFIVVELGDHHATVLDGEV